VAVVYSIRDWNDHFEVSQSRKISGPLSWVGIPCKHDGKSFRRIMMMPDGPEIFCAWILIVQVAAKCPQRGVLADADGPLDTTDLFVKTGCPDTIFAKALKVLEEPKIGWIFSRQWEMSGSDLPTHDPTNQTEPTRQNPTNQPTEHDKAAGRLADMNGFSLGWEAIGTELCKLEVARWQDAIAGAKAAGCTAGQAMLLIDFGKAHGFGPGAIVSRMKAANPALPVESGWPGKPKAAVKADAAARAKAELAIREQRVNEADAIIRNGRRAQKPDSEIQAELTAAGLEWPK
jgi:hypothetical protein